MDRLLNSKTGVMSGYDASQQDREENIMTVEAELVTRIHLVFVKLGLPMETLPAAYVTMRLGLVVGMYHREWTQAYLKITEDGVPDDTPSDTEAARSFVELVPIETVTT